MDFEKDDDGFRLIESFGQLRHIALNRNLRNKRFRLACDLNARSSRIERPRLEGKWKTAFLKCKGFDRIPVFRGVLDGDGHKIKNLYINDDRETGGLAHNNYGIIANLTLENVNVTGEEIVGGVVASNKGLIKNVTVRGEITGRGDTCVGGIVGTNVFSAVGIEDCGTIRGCKFNGKISSGYRGWVGGIAGDNGSTIEESNASGRIEGTHAGCLVGLNNGEIKLSYSSVDDFVRQGQIYGRVVGLNEERVENCYWIGAEQESGISIDNGNSIGVRSVEDTTELERILTLNKL